MHFHAKYFVSDGAAAQYKNRKNFVNLCQHEEDFGVAAEWHFSATSHGKVACDGVGGTVKGFAARASLSKVYSSSSIPKVERVTIEEGDLVLQEMKGRVSFAYNDDWLLPPHRLTHLQPRSEAKWGRSE